MFGFAVFLACTFLGFQLTLKPNIQKLIFSFVVSRTIEQHMKYVITIFKSAQKMQLYFIIYFGINGGYNFTKTCPEDFLP